MIEGAEGIPSDPDEHPPLLVAFVQDLWLDSVGMGAVSCTTNPFMYYYPAGIAHDQDTKTCSSGSWQASAVHMLRFLSAARYGKVLGPQMNDLLLSTALADVSGLPGSAPMGWDPRGSTAYSRGYLSKNGGKPWFQGGYHQVETCIHRLPEGVDAVLLINDDSPDDPCRILRRAYSAQ